MNHLHFVYHYWKAWEGPLLHQKPDFFILYSSDYFIFFSQVWYKAKQNLSYEMTTNILSDTFLRVDQYLYWQLPFHLLMKTLLGEKKTYMWSCTFRTIVQEILALYYLTTCNWQEFLCTFSIKGLPQQYYIGKNIYTNIIIYLLEEKWYLPEPAACHS